VWVANYNSNNAMRIDPAAGPIGTGGVPIGAVDLTVDLGAGAAPYNYSDMTGFVAIGTNFGAWTVVHDGGMPGLEWGTISWNGLTPAGSNLKVEARASDSEAGLGGETFMEVSSGVPFTLTGRFIEIRTTFTRDADAASPVLFDLTVEPANEPPVALCADRVVAADPGTCAASDVSVDNGTFDPDDNLVSVVQAPPPPYPLGTTPVTLTATDAFGETDTCDATITVQDVEPPVMTVTATPDVLWSPNHKMVPIAIVVTSADACDGANAVSCEIVSVASDEFVNALGDGNTDPDWMTGPGPLELQLRAERSGKETGRTYTIGVACTDAAGNETAGTVMVTVPHSQGK
jgi:hypothetical protein